MKKSSSKGNILIVALIMIVVISGFVGVAFNATNNASRLADRSRDHVVEQAAVEGAVEYAYGVWKKRLVQNPALLGSNFNTGLTSPNFSGLTYASNLRIDPLDQYGAIAGAPTAVLTDLPQFKGWRGQTFNYMARAKILRNGSPSDYAFGIRRQFGYSQVPLFQAMYFFEHNIEIYRPAPIIVSGLVHTNADAYLSGSNAGTLVFEGNVSYAGTYSESADPPFAYTWSGYSPNSQIPPTRPNGQPVVAEKVPRMEPLGIEPEAVIDATDVNPNNDSMRELIEPPNTDYTDKDEISSRRLYNKAGLLINIDGSTITVTGQNGLAVSSATETAIRNTISAKATIYDQRDGRNVEVSSVDIGALRTALSTGAGGFNNVLYIHDTTPLTNTNNMPKAIRLQNGGILPDNGLTVASENPIYIKGDYNTGTTSDPLQVPANASGNPTNSDIPTVAGYTRKPSAVIGDAVMLLSNNWSDSASSLALGSRDAANTTYNTAIISGFMQSGHQPESGSRYGYSGGAINFPRFLENWSGNACTYYGSMVELFESKTATGRWDTGVIYRPPNRRFNFDTNFMTAPPPGGVSATTYSRGSWSKY